MKIYTLQRLHFYDYGIISILRGDPLFAFVTLEHAYEDSDGAVAPKLPDGTYTCQRGQHVLGNGEHIEAFEVMNVPGHSGILFHIGNFNRDSEGCILLGKTFDPGDKMICSSAIAFKQFMGGLQDDNVFQLIVETDGI